MSATSRIGPAEHHGYWALSARRFLRHRPATIGAAILMLLTTSAAAAPWLTPYGFDEIDLTNLLGSPARDHWLGTDEVGHDVLTRLLYAGRVSLVVGFVAAAIAVVVGATVGLLAGYRGGLLDRLAMRVTDMMLSIPAIAAMLVLARVVGPGMVGILVVLTLLGWMPTARLVRGETLRLRAMDFVDAARSLGASDLRIMVRHVLPNAAAPIIVSGTIYVGIAILAESTISYFGLGVQPPVPSWGGMLRNAQEYLWNAPRLAFYPGAFIFLTVLSVNFVGDGLRDALDPRVARRY